MSRRKPLELDSAGRLQALWTLDGLRIPAEHAAGLYLSYLPDPKRYVLSVLAIDPETFTLRWRAVQEGRSGIRLLRALRELTERLEGRGQARTIPRPP